MPTARTEVAVAEVGGKIYVVGGFGGERELEIYDSAADRWSRGASADLGATSAQLKRRKLRSDITQA